MESWSEDCLNMSADESHYKNTVNKRLPLGFVNNEKLDISDESSVQFMSRSGTNNSSSNMSGKFMSYKEQAMSFKKIDPVQSQETRCFNCFII